MDKKKRASVPGVKAVPGKTILDFFKLKTSLPTTSHEKNSNNKRPSIEDVHPAIKFTPNCLVTAKSNATGTQENLFKKQRTQNKPKGRPLGIDKDIIFLSSDDDDDWNSISSQFEVLSEVPINLPTHSSPVKPAQLTPRNDITITRACVADEQEDEDPEVVKLKETCDVDMTEFLDVLIQEKDDHVDTVESSSPNKVFSSFDSDHKWNSFRNMLDFVLGDWHFHHHLFDDGDWKIIESFTSLSFPAQRLFVRLYLRKHQWIRSNRIKYPDINDDLDPLIYELTHANLIQPCDRIDNLPEALELLDMDEVKGCVKSIKVPSVSTGSFSCLSNSYSNKPALIESIIKHAKSSQSIKSHFTANGNPNPSSVEDVVLNQ